MESPKFEIMESNVFQTNRLLDKMEEKMRSQLKESGVIEGKEDYDDIRSTKRKKQKENQGFKNEKELEKELEEFREKLKGIDKNEEFYEGKNIGKSFSEEKKRFFGEKEGVSEEKSTVRGFPLENSGKKQRDFSAFSNIKQKKNNENIEENIGFSELKYGLEIRMLREDLQRLKSSKIQLEKEIFLLKSHLKLKKKPEKNNFVY